MSKRAKTILILVIIQILTLIYMIVDKNYTLKFGKSYLLKALPVDPRSLFRGDYVILKYDISNLTYKYNVNNEEINKNEKIYLSIKKDKDGFLKPISFTKYRDKVLKNYDFIVGRVSNVEKWISSNKDYIYSNKISYKISIFNTRIDCNKNKFNERIGIYDKIYLVYSKGNNNQFYLDYITKHKDKISKNSIYFQTFVRNVYKYGRTCKYNIDYNFKIAELSSKYNRYREKLSSYEDIYLVYSYDYINEKYELKYFTSMKNRIKHNEYFLKAKLTRINLKEYFINYGLESYFVEQGKGREIEKIRNKNKVIVEIKVDNRGKSAINNFYIDNKEYKEFIKEN